MEGAEGAQWRSSRQAISGGCVDGNIHFAVLGAALTSVHGTERFGDCQLSQ